MPENLENYEVVYTHPGGAVITFTRQDGELDSLAKGLDSEQFWVFKNVKALLARNDEGDLDEATRLMAGLGFTGRVRELSDLTSAQSSPAREAAQALAETPETHGHIHLPGPSLWPVMLAGSVMITLVGLLFWETTLFVTVIGAAMTFACGVGWGLDAI
ncbi:MAG TPA: hypothetical protein VKQ36_11055 [Ktedonobacterales bacterium]|nr:hypothetical protein [Ktedonobacterales bacterium]